LASSFVYNGLFTFWRKIYIAQLVSFIYIILPQDLNFHYFSLFMKIHTTVVVEYVSTPTLQAYKAKGNRMALNNGRKPQCTTTVNWLLNGHDEHCTEKNYAIFS